MHTASCPLRSGVPGCASSLSVLLLPSPVPKATKIVFSNRPGSPGSVVSYSCGLWQVSHLSVPRFPCVQHGASLAASVAVGKISVALWVVQSPAGPQAWVAVPVHPCYQEHGLSLQFPCGRGNAAQEKSTQATWTPANFLVATHKSETGEINVKNVRTFS